MYFAFIFRFSLILGPYWCLYVALSCNSFTKTEMGIPATYEGSLHKILSYMSKCVIFDLAFDLQWLLQYHLLQHLKKLRSFPTKCVGVFHSSLKINSNSCLKLH